MNKINDKNNIKEEKKEKKKKKFKINWSKVCIWLALLAMIGSAIAAIISPLLGN